MDCFGSIQGDIEDFREPTDQVLFSTIRGSGWPRLDSISAGVEIWPSATANGTE